MNTENIQPNLIPTERRKLSFGFWFLYLLGFIISTQILRELVLHNNFKIFLNEKFAFSLNIPITIIYILYLIVFTLIVQYLYHHWENLTSLLRLGFILIMAGGLSNLGERIYFGHVVDYIFLFNGVLNLADLFIFLGVFFVLISRTNSEKV